MSLCSTRNKKLQQSSGLSVNRSATRPASLMRGVRRDWPHKGKQLTGMVDGRAVMSKDSKSTLYAQVQAQVVLLRGSGNNHCNHWRHLSSSLFYCYIHCKEDILITPHTLFWISTIIARLTVTRESFIEFKSFKTAVFTEMDETF